MTALAVIHKEAILDYLRSGQRIEDAIQGLGLGIRRQSVWEALKDDPDYKEAIVQWHVARLDESERMIKDCPPSMPDVARAKAYAEAVRWRAAKEVRDRWGDDNPLARHLGDMQVTINIGSVAQPSVTIEHEPDK